MYNFSGVGTGCDPFLQINIDGAVSSGYFEYINDQGC